MRRTPETVIPKRLEIRTNPSVQTLRARLCETRDDLVAQGAPVACLRDTPDVKFVATEWGGEWRAFRFTRAQAFRNSTVTMSNPSGDGWQARSCAAHDGTPNLRLLIKCQGLGRGCERRLSGSPPPMNAPSRSSLWLARHRPFAPDPRKALLVARRVFSRACNAWQCDRWAAIFGVCQQSLGPAFLKRGCRDASTRLSVGAASSAGVAGPAQFMPLHLCDNRAPVWDIHAEDVAAVWRSSDQRRSARSTTSGARCGGGLAG